MLDGDYAAESLAYLTSPSYSLPDNSSARLSFRSWVCTETDWDGGAVQISVDDGATWWYPPYDSHTHHTLSRMNPYSPFYDEGIFDGSIHSGGCPTRSQTSMRKPSTSATSRAKRSVSGTSFSPTRVERRLVHR